jgi:hypothetical protein
VQSWVNCQNEMIVYAPQTIAEQPAASPSRPSVRLTALENPAMNRYARTTKPTEPRNSGPMSRT